MDLRCLILGKPQIYKLFFFKLNLLEKWSLSLLGVRLKMSSQVKKVALIDFKI